MTAEKLSRFRLPTLAATVIALGLATGLAAAGEAEDLSGRLDRIEAGTTELAAMLGRPVPPADVPGTAPGAYEPVAFGSSSRQMSEMTVRIDNLENQLRSLTGQIEQLNFEIRQLQDRIQRMQEDNEFRFQDLEKSGPGKRSDAGAPAETTASIAAPSTAAATPPRASEPATLGQVPAASQTAATADAPGRPLDLSTLIANGGILEKPVETGTPGVKSQQLVLAPSGDPRDEYDLAYGYILRGDYGLAEASFNQFLETHPGHPLSADAQYWLGESYYGQGEYRDAANAFLAVYKEYPSAKKVPDSLLKLASSLGELGETSTACATFDKLLSDFPNASNAVRQRAIADRAKYSC